VAAQSRATLPVFGGISGSTSATFITSLPRAYLPSFTIRNSGLELGHITCRGLKRSVPPCSIKMKRNDEVRLKFSSFLFKALLASEVCVRR